MRFSKRYIIFIFGFVVMLAVTCYAEQTALEQYINTPDSVFEYSLVKTRYDIFYITYVFELTSQSWHPDEVSPEVWQHWVVVVEPWFLGEYTENIPLFSLVRTDKAFFNVVKGDEEHEDIPSQAKDLTVRLAIQNRSIAAEIHGIPIGPVSFLDEEMEPDWLDELNPFYDPDDDKVLRKEDSLQARSLDIALSTGDFTWASMAPMVKGVIRGMDLVQEFSKTRHRGRNTVKKFVLAGHSKRAWTTWLTGAMDERVAGIAPLGFDLLNTLAQSALQEAFWDEQSEELRVYEEFDIFERFKSETGKQLLANIDPYEYIEHLNIPTLILVGTNDNYSNVDSINLYLDDLPGDTRIFYDPDKGHDIRDSVRAQDSIAAFYRHIVQNRPMPEFVWGDLTDGDFEVIPVNQKPVEVTLWSAFNPYARDFRESAEIQWTSSNVSANGNGSYTGNVPQPSSGYTAFYIELTYNDGEKRGAPYSLATPMTVLGD